jgi:hypothetical protein
MLQQYDTDNDHEDENGLLHFPISLVVTNQVYDFSRSHHLMKIIQKEHEDD